MFVGVRSFSVFTQRPVDFPSAVQVSKVHSQEQLQKDEGEKLTLITGLCTQVHYTHSHTHTRTHTHTHTQRERIGLSFPARLTRAPPDHLHS